MKNTMAAELPQAMFDGFDDFGEQDDFAVAEPTADPKWDDPNDPINAKPPPRKRRLRADDWMPFPTKVLPTRMKDFVVEAAAALAVDESMVALPAITVVAAAIGNSHIAQLKTDWEQLPILWTACIGRSGTRKTAAMKCAIQAAENYQLWAAQQYRMALAQHASDQMDGQCAGAAHPNNEGEPSAEPPAFPHHLSTDFTAEAVDLIFAEQRRGLLLASEELAGLFKALGQYKQGKGNDQQKLLEWYDGGMSKRDRANKASSISRRRSAWITGGLQPTTFWETMGGRHETDGMLSRFLLAWPPPTTVGVSNVELARETIDDWQNLINCLYAIPCDDEPERVPFDAHARQLVMNWCNGSNQTAINNPETSEIEVNFRAKQQGRVLRLALILHLIKRVDDDGAMGIAIDSNTAQDAITLIEWFTREAIRIYRKRDEVQSAAQNVEDDRVMAFIRSRREVTVRDLQIKFRRKFQYARNAEEYLKTLAMDGQGRWGEIGQRRVFRING